MPKPDLGRKHECSECGARFYDLGKEPATCPKCGTVSTFASVQFQSVSAAGVKKSHLQSHLKKVAPDADIDEDEDESMDVEELDLDDAQAERHLNEAMSGDDDDEVDSDLAEVNEFDEEELPDEVEVVADDDDDSDELEDDLEDEDD